METLVLYQEVRLLSVIMSDLRVYTFVLCCIATIIIPFFIQQKEYIYNPKTEKCTAEQVTSPFRPIGVPDGARYLEPLWIGLDPSATNGLSVDIWEAQVPDSQ